MNEPLDPIVADAYDRHSKAMLAWRALTEEERKTAPAPAWSDAMEAAKTPAAGASPASPTPAPAPEPEPAPAPVPES